MPSLAAEPALVRALHDRTDGLPLFVAGVVDDLLARPASHADPHERLAAMAMPDTLSGVIERYVEELTPEQRSLLEAASVCGVQFRLSTVAHALDADAMVLADTCAEVARGQRWLKDIALAANSPPAESGYVHCTEVLYSACDSPASLHQVGARGAVQASTSARRARRSTCREPMAALATSGRRIAVCTSRRGRRELTERAHCLR